MTAIANLTPTSPVALPWTYVTNGGQAYSLSSAQGAGCVDTVTPLTANAGGTFNVKGVPLYPSQSYGVIAQADQQYGPVVIACQSLVNQLGTSSTANSGVPSQWRHLRRMHSQQTPSSTMASALYGCVPDNLRPVGCREGLGKKVRR